MKTLGRVAFGLAGLSLVASSLAGCSTAKSLPKVCTDNKSLVATLNKAGTADFLSMAGVIAGSNYLYSIGWNMGSHTSDENNARLLQGVGVCLTKTAYNEIAAHGVFN